jgi:hypothetical protein
MIFPRKFVVLVPIAACGVLGAVWAAPPAIDQQPLRLGNSYYLYTGALAIDESGVAPIPSRFQWSVETSWRGGDGNGNDLPDSRVMLRLYDPDRNFTALTAQMDLETATRLQHELTTIIAQKRKDPTFQFRPQLYGSQDIPTKRIIGVDQNGTAIVEDAPGK